MSPQNLCNLIWAPVTLGAAHTVDPSLWESMAYQAVLKMANMSGLGVSNMLWAYAKMGYR